MLHVFLLNELMRPPLNICGESCDIGTTCGAYCVGCTLGGEKHRTTYTGTHPHSVDETFYIHICDNAKAKLVAFFFKSSKN